MTFLRKRSRSQCSMFSCDDEYSMSRQGNDDISKYVRQPSNTQVTAPDYDLYDSCVLRNFPKHKSAHLRFLAWVQYTRQFPDHSITEDERRTCPLLWCRTTFHDQDTMLKHVWNCEYLSKGLYWCFQCQKPERVGRFQCKRCQGGSSKTDRIATVARKMFSALGARKSINKGSVLSQNGRNSTCSKVSEATEIVDLRNPNRISEGEATSEISPSYWDPMYVPELPNNYVSEMEDTYVVPEMSCGWKDLAQIQVSPPAEDTYHNATSSDTVPEIPAVRSNPLLALETGSCVACINNHGRESPRPNRAILPRLVTNTQPGINRAPHNLGFIFPLSNKDLSNNIVSPLSASDGFDCGTLGTIDISPTDSEVSGTSIFTDSGYSSATVESSWYGSDWDLGVGRSISKAEKEKEGVFRTCDAKGLIGWGLPSDNHSFATTQICEVTRINTMTSSVDVSTSHPANRCNTQNKTQNLSPHWFGDRSMVNSFSQVLHEHLQHSRISLKQMASSVITRELLSLSISSIISIGFSVLTGLIEGRRPTAIVPLFAFTHIAYALAIAVDHDEAMVQSREWFQDSLSLLDGLCSEKQRQVYTQIVRVIWQPRSLAVSAENVSVSDSSIEYASSDCNRLVRACKHFLDIEESFSYSMQLAESGSASQFDFMQASFANKVRSYRVIDVLIEKISIEAFIEDVVNVEKRLNNGLTKELRQLELELICAGKRASQSPAAFVRFEAHVNQLCDAVRLGDSTFRPRTAHHLDTIARTQELLPEEEESEDDNGGIEAEFEFDFNFLDSTDSTWNAVATQEMDELLAIFSQDANNTPAPPHSSGSGIVFEERDRYDQRVSVNTVSQLSHAKLFNTPNARPKVPEAQELSTFPNRSQTLSREDTSISPSSTDTVSPASLSTRNKYRCHCGYEPSGSEEWKASNFARHQRNQHAPPKVYRCKHPGCKAKYRRSDNLRAHLKLKGHGEEETAFDTLGNGSLEPVEEDDKDEHTSSKSIARPSKRVKGTEGRIRIVGTVEDKHRDC